MRVFDTFIYNIVDKVKFKDTKPYIDKMLSELKLKYDSVIFTINEYMTDYDTILAKYPELEKYRYYYEPYGEDLLTSITPQWADGEYLVAKEDEKSIFEVFSRIPRGFNVSGVLVLNGIDWFGDGSREAAVTRDDYVGEAQSLEVSPIINSAVVITRDTLDGNKFNTLKVIIETTSEEEPKDTAAIIDMLKPYLGEPEEKIRSTAFELKESADNREAADNFSAVLERKIAERIPYDQEYHVAHMLDEYIQKLVDKNKLKKAFKNTGYEFEKRKAVYPGTNQLFCIDKHNYRFEVLTVRTQNMPKSFDVYISIIGCNFRIKNFGYTINASSEEEAVKQLQELADFCVELRDDFGDEIYERFGETPEWYWTIED